MKKMSSQQLLAAALKDLMETHPFDEISIADILHDSGVSRTTFYKYFYCKENLLEHIFHEEIVEELFYDFSRPCGLRDEDVLNAMMRHRGFYLHALDVPCFQQLWNRTAYESTYAFYKDCGLNKNNLLFFIHSATAAFVRVNSAFLRGEIAATPAEIAQRFEVMLGGMLSALLAQQ